MSSPLRRKYGTPTVGVQVDIAPEVKMLIDRYMAAANVPQWAIIEAAIRAGKPGADGIPEGWVLGHQRDQERPMDMPVRQPHKGRKRGFYLRLPEPVADQIKRIANHRGTTYQEVLCAIVCEATGNPQYAPVLPPVSEAVDPQGALDFPEEGDAVSS